MDELRKELVQSYFNQMSGAMQDMDPDGMQRMKDMFDALNQMLEQRERGEPIDPSFEEFMERFGDFFPQNPQNLDELLEQMAAADGGHAGDAQLDDARAAGPASGARPSSCSRTWTCSGRCQRLQSNLQQAFPAAGWDRRYNFSGQDPLGLRRGAPG